MKTAGIKDLKNRLSYYLREVKKGEKILITERN
ncbi:MAG: type II toxin-antitoxin system prevent-host-death family antitoxin, partial [Deltaproteobacteria bacterium]|nr:type II toxin-antitoxin system prevent-host-death family antitoxin [Deltaproteobacteria bacterium]